MSLTLDELSELPSPFYRVAVKALVLDDEKRLLIVINEDNEAELPGGGWEHDESLETCIQREIYEELGVQAADISDLQFIFRGQSDHGWEVLRVVVRVELTSHDFVPADGMTDARFVSKEELMELNFDVTDMNVKEYIDKIWSKEV